MGSCCSKKHLTKRKAFHQDLGVPLLESLAPQLGKNARVIAIRLVELKDIAGMMMYGTKSNPFLQLRLMPEDEIGGPQHQSSSIVPGTLNPRWEPPEHFQFVVSDVRKARILLSVFHYDEDRPKENFPIGDSVIKLDAVSLTDVPKQFQFKLVNPKDGKAQGEVVLMLSELLPKDAQREVHETVFEYQEWHLVGDWRALADPGRWSTADGKVFKEDLEEVGMALPEGWKVKHTWSILGNDSDPDGWQYATQLDSACWYPQNNSSLFVLRRRKWTRDLHKPAKGSSPRMQDRNSGTGHIKGSKKA